MTARGLWSRDMIGWAMVAALLPPAAVVLVEQGVEGVLRIGAVLAVASLWQLLFRRQRGVPWSPTGVVLAVSMAVLAPSGLSPLQLALGASFGIVLADLIFGGWGRNVVGAAPVALEGPYRPEIHEQVQGVGADAPARTERTRNG